MYVWTSHRIFVGKSCDGSFRKLAIGWELFWLYPSHSHCSLLVGVVANKLMFWSNILASDPWICIVGTLMTNFLFVLHSLMDDVRLGVSIGGLMTLWSLDC